VVVDSTKTDSTVVSVDSVKVTAEEVK
jgi:hypothetical protein